jgi:hypothetical protein
MSFRTPMASGSETHEAPCCLWELKLEVEFDPWLTAEELDGKRRALGEAIVLILEGLTSSFDAGVDLLEVGGRGRETPLFPLVAGDARFTAHIDVLDLVERNCAAAADLAQIAYDAAGRAYELDVDVVYHRRPALDQQGRAEMPAPIEVVQVRRARMQPRPFPHGSGKNHRYDA